MHPDAHGQPWSSSDEEEKEIVDEEDNGKYQKIPENIFSDCHDKRQQQELYVKKLVSNKVDDDNQLKHNNMQISNELDNYFITEHSSDQVSPGQENYPPFDNDNLNLMTHHILVVTNDEHNDHNRNQEVEMNEIIAKDDEKTGEDMNVEKIISSQF